MKQILQNLENGVTEVADLPAPQLKGGQLLIKTSRSLVSSGTERMLVDFGKAGWISKARSQPDKVRMVLDKVKTDGILPTYSAIQSKLEQPLAVGYCNAGVVVDLGAGLSGKYKVGDRIASNGKHAEIVSVPENLCAKIPPSVTDEEAAFTPLIAIALQGVRLVGPSLGESYAVIGLGLIGLLTVQLLRANGCRVIGFDFDGSRLALAKEFGAEVVDLSSDVDPARHAIEWTQGMGVDGVLITASTSSNDPIHHAAKMSRQRGRIILVGVTGLELSRADFYEKELVFQVSCSYGPGRYDTTYEDKGIDYPSGFVRWTAQRNFEAALYLISNGSVNLKKLISHRFPIDHAAEAYDLISSNSPSLGVLIEYPTVAPTTALLMEKVGGQIVSDVQNKEIASIKKSSENQACIGFIGAGNYAISSLMPDFKKTSARLISVSNRNGVGSYFSAKKFGIQKTEADVNEIFGNDSIDTVVISTKHDSHADLVIRSLNSNKNVYVEKPLCLDLVELDNVKAAYFRANDIEKKSAAILMVGFNRRFSPLTVKMKSLLSQVSSAKTVVMTINAGSIDGGHWTQDELIGGGRILGEACHFIDLIRYLVGVKITGFSAVSANATNPHSDSVIINLQFLDGSCGVINYLTNGSKSYPKETIEVFSGGKILRLSNFKKLEGWGWSGFKKMSLFRQDKGQKRCVQEFVSAIENNMPSPIPVEEIFEVSEVTIKVAKGIL